MKKCKRCGTSFEGNFCPSCGEKADPACPSCGAAYTQGARFCPSCGKPLNGETKAAQQSVQPVQPAQNQTARQADYIPSVPPAAAPQQPPRMGPMPSAVPGPAVPAPGAHGILPHTYAPSKFTGGAFGRFGVNLLVVIVTAVTLTLGLPAMICFKQRYMTKRTYINGRRLTFDGRAVQLIGRYILWLLLSVITLGIYLLFLTNATRKWTVSHTHFEGVQGGTSKFTGSAVVKFFVNLWALIVTVITLTLGAHWATCFKQRWYWKNTVIDGHRCFFSGKGIQLFGKRILWGLLTVITIGIFFFWYKVRVQKWLTSHTHVYPYLDPAVPQPPVSLIGPVPAAAPATPQQAVPVQYSAAQPSAIGIPAYPAQAQAVSPAAPAVPAVPADNAAPAVAPAEREKFPEIPPSVEMSQPDADDIAAIRAQYPSLRICGSDLKAAPETAEGGNDTPEAPSAVAAETSTGTAAPAEQSAPASADASGAAEDISSDTARDSGTPASRAEEGRGKSVQTIRISVPSLLYALPAAVFLLMSVLLFLFMTASASPDLFGLNYYELPDLMIAESSAAMSIACTSLLPVFSVLLSAVSAYGLLRKKDVRIARISLKYILEGVCALLAVLVFVAACILLGDLGEYELSAGAAPVLCIVFSLLSVAGAAAAESVARIKFADALAFEGESVSAALSQARIAADKKFLHPDLKEDGVFAVEREDKTYADDHKIGEALAYANKGSARRSRWPFVIALICLSAGLAASLIFYIMKDPPHPASLAVTSVVFIALLFASVIVCLKFTASAKQYAAIGKDSSLNDIRKGRSDALRLAAANGILAVLSVTGMILVNALTANALLHYAEISPILFANFYFLRTNVCGLGELFLYYTSIVTLAAGAFKAFAELRRFRAYAYAGRELAKTVENADAPPGARWAMLRNALRENALAAKKQLKHTEGSRQEKAVTPRLKRFIASAVCGVLCLAVLFGVYPAVQAQNESLANVTNMIVAYKESYYSHAAADLLFGEPSEIKSENERIYRSANYRKLEKRIQELAEKVQNGEIGMAEYMEKLAKLSAEAASMTYRELTVSENRVYSRVVNGMSFGSGRAQLDSVTVAVCPVPHSSAHDRRDLADAIASEGCYYIAYATDGSVEIADFDPSRVEIISKRSDSVKISFSVSTAFGTATKQTATVRLHD